MRAVPQKKGHYNGEYRTREIGIERLKQQKSYAFPETGITGRPHVGPETSALMCACTHLVSR